MGYFTWTDAKKVPSKMRDGEWNWHDVIQYGACCRIVLPDDSCIETPAYDGYGRFGAHDEVDAYDVVVDMNREHLSEIFDRMASKTPDHWGIELKPIACAYEAGDDQLIQAEIEKLLKSKPNYLHWIKEEWKRNIGIAIACDNDDNAALPYPLKITTKKGKVKYVDLVPSYSTQ